LLESFFSLAVFFHEAQDQPQFTMDVHPGARAVPVAPKVEVVELTGKPQNATTTHIFVDLCQPTFLAGKPAEGVVVLVVLQPIKVQRLCLVWYVSRLFKHFSHFGRKGLEHVSWWQGGLSADKNVTGTEWWVARRLHLIPDDGTASM
jgi:hypothetical protein